MLMETDCIRRAKNGDERAFEQLVSAYEKKIYSIAYRNSGNEQDALDITQEVFIRVFRSLPGFKEESSFSTWIYRIASNLCIDFSRKKQGKGTLSFSMQGEDGEDILMDMPDPSGGPELALQSKELREEIGEALLKLSESHRQVVILRDISGLSYTEISDVLSIPEGTIKSRLARARENLRRLLICRGTCP